MNDLQIKEYLVSHAPLERFYIFAPPGAGAPMMKFIDSAGRPWNIMEDDDAFVERAIEFLKNSGIKVFKEYSALLQYEQQFAQGAG